MSNSSKIHVVQDTNRQIAPEYRAWTQADGEEPYDTSLFVSPRCAYNLGAVSVKSQTTSPDTLSADDWALCIIKPDAKELHLEDRILDMTSSLIPSASIVSSLTDVTLSIYELDQIWPVPEEIRGKNLPTSPWWTATIDYMLSAPVDVHLVKGMGASGVLLSIKSMLRQEFYGEGYQNDTALPVEKRVVSIMHTSDCDSELIGNMLAFWDHKTIRNMAGKE